MSIAQKIRDRLAGLSNNDCIRLCKDIDGKLLRTKPDEWSFYDSIRTEYDQDFGAEYPDIIGNYVFSKSISQSKRAAIREFILNWSNPNCENPYIIHFCSIPKPVELQVNRCSRLIGRVECAESEYLTDTPWWQLRDEHKARPHAYYT